MHPISLFQAGLIFVTNPANIVATQKTFLGKSLQLTSSAFVFTLSDEKQNNLDNPWLDFLANLIFSSEDMILTTVLTIYRARNHALPGHCPH